MFDPEIKTVEAETVAFIEMQGPYAQMPEGFGRLYGWVAQRGLTPRGMPEAVYLTAPDQVPEDQARWELWAPVEGEIAEQAADESGCGVKRVSERGAACAMHAGPYETVGETYGLLVQWLAGQGRTIAGPPEEVYFSDPDEVPPEEYLTEVRFPVSAK